MVVTRPKYRRTLGAMGAIALLVLAADLALKRLVTDALGPHASRHSWWLIDGVLGFEYMRNSGAAFGILRGNAELLAAVSLIVGIGFVWLLLHELDAGFRTAASGGLIVGGWIGNLVERFGDGYVTDYIAIGPWPRFNVADASITIAIVIFLVAVVFEGEVVTTGGEQSEGRRDGQA